MSPTGISTMGRRRPDEPRLDRAHAALRNRPDRPRVAVRAAAILLIYAGCAALVLQPGLWYAGIAIWPFCGLMLSGFLQAAHDCIHRTHLASRAGNRIMGALWCAPLLVNFTIYRYRHLEHHRHTGVAGDTESHIRYSSVWPYLRAVSGAVLWRPTVETIVRTWRGRFPACIESDARRSEARWDNLAVCCWLAAAVAMTVAFPRAVLFVYWLPMLFYASAAIVVSLPEHYGLAGLDGVARNTRSIRSNRVVRFVLWNANYHAEHHAFPSIPTVHLHRVHEAAVGVFEHQERSYFGFHLALLRRLLAGAGRDAEK